MDSQPLVTVVMPIRNEAGFIRRSLGACWSRTTAWADRSDRGRWNVE